MSIEKLRANLAHATKIKSPGHALIATVVEVEAALLDYGALMAEVSQLRAELSYIANARTGDEFKTLKNYRGRVKNRARHALNQKPGELTIKKS